MNKKEYLSLGVFLVSLFLIGFVFFLGINTDVNIQIDKEKNISTKVPANFSILTTVFLMILTILATLSVSYYASDLSRNLNLNRKQKLTVNMLEGDEKRMYLFVLEKEECLQKDLVYELGFTKAKVTRVLDKLEQKKILVRISYGKTNKIIAKE